MPEDRELEFTGERVVPGLVDPNLFNEHLARYRFSARFAESARVLDAGCGSGYGTAELTRAAAVTAIDISAEAVSHARARFGREGVRFLQGSCEALPFADGSFDLVLAFEVIEHLEHWDKLIAETNRVLGPAGVLLVSTPNKAWYAESRAGAGPNPYHVHEFEYGEFEAALRGHFPHVRLWSQNHSEAIAFVPAESSLGTLDAPADEAPTQAHFYLAACSRSPISETSAFAWLPSSGNVLRERQTHISLLETELRQKDAWLDQAKQSLSTLQAAHEDLLQELREKIAWAGRLNGDIGTARQTIADLQTEIGSIHAGYREQLSRLEEEAAERLDWAHRLETETAAARTEIARLNSENLTLEATVVERTQWAQERDAEVARLGALLERERNQWSHLFNQIARSFWFRLGRLLKLIPGGKPPGGKPPE